MVVGFKDRFVPMVEDGSKTHTIRAGNRWRVGMRADLFARPRQRQVFALSLDGQLTQVAGMRLLFRAPVVGVQKIKIYEYEAVQSGRGPISPLNGNHVRNAMRGPNGESLLLTLDGVLLDADEARAFFVRDGFREKGTCPQYGALQFWQQRLPFTGQLIHWNYEQRHQ